MASEWDGDRRGINPRKRHRERYLNSREEDADICEDCGERVSEDAWVEVHHIDGDYRNGANENLVAVCHHCHLMRQRRASTERRVGQLTVDRLTGGQRNV